MAVVLQGTPSLYENASSASVVVPYPAGVTAGEVLLLHVANSAATMSATPPSGWTVANVHPTANASPSVAVFYRVADGTESGSVTYNTGAAAGRITGIMERWSGVDTTTPLDVTPVASDSPIATSFTMPSITTANNDTVLVHSIGLNAATAADIVTLAGETLISKSTGTGRRLGAYYETLATAGATGTRTWTETPTTTALQWAGITVALRSASPGSGGTPTPTLVQRIVGVTTTPSSSAVVQVKTTDATSVRLKVSTDSAGTTGVAYSSPVTPSANGDSRLTITGLTAATQYYYRVEMTDSASGTQLDTGSVGKFKTAPSGQASFAFDFSSCNNSTDSAAMAAIAARGDDLFFHLGDLYYDDGASTTVQSFRDHINAKLQAPNHQAVFSAMNTSYTPSDHDSGMNNNSAAGNAPTALANWNTAHDELFPTNDTYYTFTWGRVKFIQLDDRSYKSDPAATDDASKTALGATQKQWLKDQITNATEPLIVIIQSAVWVGAAVAGDDGWMGFTTERAELGAHFSASGKNIMMIGGDMHAVAADNGSNAVGGIVTLQAAPLNNGTSIKGGPFSEGTYPASGSAGAQQYGRVAITDNGSTIDMAFVGYSSDNTARISYSKTYTAAATQTVAPTGLISTAALGSPTVSAPAHVAPSGIATAKSLGTPALSTTVHPAPTGIASAKAVGSPTLTMKITAAPSGIASARAVGTPTLQFINAVVPVGIGSARALGAPTLSGSTTVHPAGIATKKAFGSPTAVSTAVLRPSGIPTKRFTGQPTLLTISRLGPAGIASLAAVGTPAIAGGGPFQTNYEVTIPKKRWKGSLG